MKMQCQIHNGENLHQASLLHLVLPLPAVLHSSCSITLSAQLTGGHSYQIKIVNKLKKNLVMNQYSAGQIAFKMLLEFTESVPLLVPINKPERDKCWSLILLHNAQKMSHSVS